MKERSIICDMKIEVGQIWKDNDPRFFNTPIYKEVLRVDDKYAYCESNCNGLRKPVRIRLDRFVTNDRGYILVGGKKEAK